MANFRSFAIAAAVFAAACPPAQAGAGIEVTMNEAKIVKLARAADTIVIGNPGIADASVQDASTIVLTGKGFGVTNLVVLDGDGSPIIDEQVTVVMNQILERILVARMQHLKKFIDVGIPTFTIRPLHKDQCVA